MLRSTHQGVEVRRSFGVASDELGVDDCRRHRHRRERKGDHLNRLVASLPLRVKMITSSPALCS